MKKIKIIIVDDHDLFREGLKQLLDQSKNIAVIGQASNGIELLDLLTNYIPDLVLMDISMPKMDGIETTKLALNKCPNLKVITLSMFGDQEYYYKMIHAGAHGFLLKNCSGADLFEAIEKVIEGNNYFSTELLQSIILDMPGKKKLKLETDKSLINFTKREKEILNLLCTGLSSIDIGEKLFISKKTVEGHKNNLLLKTGTKNTVSLVMYAVKNKFIEI